MAFSPGSADPLGRSSQPHTAHGSGADSAPLPPPPLVSAPHGAEAAGISGDAASGLIGIDEVQKALNRSRASVYRYTNTDPRNLNPPFNPRRLNPEYRSDQKDPLLFHPHEVARFARDVLRIKEVTVEVLNSPSTATQQLLGAILAELQAIRQRLDRLDQRQDDALRPAPNGSRFDQQNRPAA
ncbi:MAG: resolvase [Synechococcaceae cyanobacterium]